jgi:hypothetical protein
MIYKREEFFEEDAANEKFPIKSIEKVTSLDGSETKYMGRVSLAINTPMGMNTLPISFELDTPTIEEAFEKFEAQAEIEIEKAKIELQEQLQELRQKAQNRIVTPGEAGGFGMAGGVGAGGPKIQL